MTKKLNKTEKCRNLVAKLDGTVKVADLVHKIMATCEFKTEMAARTYLNNARKYLRENPPKVAAPRKRTTIIKRTEAEEEAVMEKVAA